MIVRYTCIVLLYLQIFNTKNYNLFKMSAFRLFILKILFKFRNKIIFL